MTGSLNAAYAGKWYGTRLLHGHVDDLKIRVRAPAEPLTGEMRRRGDVVADVLVPPRPDRGTLRQRMLSRACEPLEVIDGELM
ncbi:hypothetical protein A7R75_11480 [Mycolicibacterium llatzerense]|nr:hypothetical protein [Mycolicibacterium llatzerense]